LKRSTGPKAPRKIGDKTRTDGPRKKSEMLEIRISLPLKQAIAEHCKSTGVNRSAFVRAAIEARLAGDYRAVPSWSGASRKIVSMIRSNALAIATVSFFLVMSINSTLVLRDASAAWGMKQLAMLNYLDPHETGTDVTSN